VFTVNLCNYTSHVKSSVNIESCRDNVCDELTKMLDWCKELVANIKR